MLLDSPEESLLLRHDYHPLTMLYVVAKQNTWQKNSVRGQAKHLILGKTEELSKNMPLFQFSRRERSKHLWIRGRGRLRVLLWRRLLQKGIDALSISENVIIFIKTGLEKRSEKVLMLQRMIFAFFMVDLLCSPSYL